MDTAGAVRIERVVLCALGFHGVHLQIEGYTAITITQILSTDCVRVCLQGETEREEEVGGYARLF
jgi:hypothetical protein